MGMKMFLRSRGENTFQSVKIFIGFLFLLAPTHSSPLKEDREWHDMTETDWWEVGREELKETLAITQRPDHAKNIILFMGDGMGATNLVASRIYKSQLEKTALVQTKLAWEKFPYTALTKTYNTDHLNGDSAGTATAFLTGVKTNQGMLGIKATVKRGDCEGSQGNEVPSILHRSHDKGLWTGFVSTSSVTDASPATLYAQVATRDWESDADMTEVTGGCKDIASQLVEDNHFIKVVLGGGRQFFLPNTQPDPEYPNDETKNGRRLDKKNLLKKWQEVQLEKEGTNENSVKLVTNKTEFDAVDIDKVDYLMGLFEPDNMQYEWDRNDPEIEVGGEPSISEMTEAALKILQKAPQGYFLFVEAGRIDHAHHATIAHKALKDTLALEEAVKMALKMTSREDTLIVVTADHSHVFTVEGPPVGQDILGFFYNLNGTVRIAQDGLPSLNLAYANGPGYLDHRTNGSLEHPIQGRRNLTEDTDKLDDKDYRQDASYPLKDESHGSEDVITYATGPMQHLFLGTHEQNYIAHALMYAGCIGEHSDKCDVSNGASSTVGYLNYLLLLLCMFQAVKVGISML